MLHTVEDTPDLSIHKYPSATLYSVIRQNLLALDQATRIGRPCYCAGWGHPQEYAATNPFRKSRGAFRYLPGMTTLTTILRVSGRQVGDTLRLYVNGSLVQSSSITADGDLTFTYTLGSFATNSVVEVEWHIYNAGFGTPDLTGGQTWGFFEVIDAWVSPVTLSDAWPGVPTFSTSYSASALSQLSNAVDWLVRRVGRRTDALFQGIVRIFGPLGPDTDWPTGQPNVRWYGTNIVTATASVLRASGEVFVAIPGATEDIQLKVNGSVVQTYTVPTSRGRYNWSFTYTLPQAAGSRVYVELVMRRLNNPITGGGEVVNRWSIIRVWCEGTAAAHATITIPTVAMRSNVTWATWKAALNACATAASTIKTRIDGNTSLWSEQRLYRGPYGYDDYQDKVFEPVYIPIAYPRQGEAILIRGEGNKVAWGAQVFDDSQQNEVGAIPLTATYTEAVNTDGTRATALVYLDALAGLPPGASYNVRGGLTTYAGEIWRVGTDV